MAAKIQFRRRWGRALLVGVILLSGCMEDPDRGATVLPNESVFQQAAEEYTLLVRLAHITDTHIIDEESPGRLTVFDGFVPVAWRPQEAYATQLLDGIIRAVNRYHRQVAAIDFLIHTGDAVDNAQSNELEWFLRVLDGRLVNPRSGPDDRPPSEIPEPLLDPHHSFQAEGLYRQGRHGDLPSIAWYGAIGNHDSFAVGVFPIVEVQDAIRVSPLPLSFRPGLVLPTVLWPAGEWTYGRITPGNPGPPTLFNGPSWVEGNPGRAFLVRREFMASHLATGTEPAGHGFAGADGPTWYSQLVADGVRLITLDTSDVPVAIPEFPYAEGAITEGQRQWLEKQLDAAAANGEWVIVATHHPSRSLQAGYNSALLPESFRDLLNRDENVVLHLAGHQHRNRVFDRGGYLEIETSSTLDYPQEGRIIEIRLRNDGSELLISYVTITHRDLGDDLSALREAAFQMAAKDAGIAAVRSSAKASAPLPDPERGANWLEGSPDDRAGTIVLPR